MDFFFFLVKCNKQSKSKGKESDFDYPDQSLNNIFGNNVTVSLLEYLLSNLQIPSSEALHKSLLNLQIQQLPQVNKEKGRAGI
jgi:hypothetical protein